MVRSPVRHIQHLQRYREIALVFIRHGFGELVESLGLAPYLSIPQRLFQQETPEWPHISAPERLRLALQELGPSFIKLGQILSTRPDLIPADYITELTKLQDTVPAAEWDAVRTLVERELGHPPGELFQTFDRTPIAAASLSQVHVATLADGAQVVVKIQRPDIQKMVEIDLEILIDLATLLQERSPLGEIYDLPATAEEFATTLRAELDFYREGRNAERLASNLADEDYLHIPTIYWAFTTRRVLTMERIQGIKINAVDAIDEAGYDRRRIAHHISRMIIKQVLEDGFFHADPHPGNFVVMQHEVIGIMDFGTVGHLSNRLRTDLINLYIATVQLDEESLVDQLIRMGVTRGFIDRAKLRRDIGRLLRKYYGMPVRRINAVEVTEELMNVAFSHNLWLPPDLWLLGKTLAMIEGLALKLYPDLDVFAVSEPYVRHFVRHRLLPRTWGPWLIKSVSDWAELLSLIPRVGTQFLTRVERGNLEITLSHKELSSALKRLDRTANRIALSMLLAALLIGMALVIPSFKSSEGWEWTTILLIIGFVFGLVGCLLLGIWLVYSIWRSRK